ncbi:MAG: Lrp/AsnC family transcriptional regulator [Clostridiales bacterium]|nr:Lrp/AsnC family transcriptional regulator [Clostridiales bacterium]
MVDHIELLRLIEKNARLTPEEIAVMLGAPADEVRAEIQKLTDDKIILG